MAKSTVRSPTHFLNLQISPEPPLLHSLLSLQRKLLTKLPRPSPPSPQPQPPSPQPEPPSPQNEPPSPQPQPPSCPQPESPSPQPESPSSPQPEPPSCPQPESPSPQPESPSPQPESPSPQPDPPPPSPQAPSPVSPENLHLTICGLRLVDDGQESEVLQLLQDLQPAGPLAGKGPAQPQPRHTVRLQGLQVFLPLQAPPAASPRGPCAVVVTVDQAQSASVMSVIGHLRQALSAFLREPLRDAGLPYTPHVTLVSQCYHDDPDSLLDEQDRAVDLGDCVVTTIYLSKLGDTTDQGVYRHRATFRL